MKPFTFDPRAFVQTFLEQGYVHIRDGLSPEFFEFARDQLVRCRQSGHNELSAREIKSKKKQYLFDLPKDEAFLGEVFQAVAALAGCSQSSMTLSERHIMIYDENATPLPTLHKDRLASEFSVGIPLEPSTNDRIALLPWSAKETNLLDTAVYDNAVYRDEVPQPLSSESFNGWSSAGDESPWHCRVERPAMVELDAKPGDVVAFRGSQIYHGRVHAARSSILYFKLNTMRLDPLGEDPSTEMQRKGTVEFLRRKSDGELLESTVELSPRLRHINRQYCRLGWKSLLRVSVSGDKEFTISDDDLSFLFAFQGRHRVRDILTNLGIENGQLLSHVPRLRRLCMLGGIDLLD